MYVARVLYPVKVLGPGNRIGIWVAGCRHHCKGCSNPELWDFQDKYNVSLENLITLIKTITKEYEVDGFTLTGGDPFEQPQDLEDLVKYLSTISRDIIVYTGYEYGCLKEKYSTVLEKIAVLIDGVYIEEKNEDCFLRGSSNQKIIVLNKDFEDLYDKYIKNGENEIQNFMTTDGIISVGIHRREYEHELDSIVTKMGLEEK